MTKYIVKFQEGSDFMMGTGVNAKDKDEALMKALGFKGDKFDPYNEIVVDAIKDGKNVTSKIVPRNHLHEFGPVELRKSVEQKEAVNIENRHSVMDLM